LKEIVGDAGIVIEGDPLSEKFQNEYVEKACTLMEDESLWQRYSTIGKERVKALYSYEISAQSLINFIKLHLILLLVSVLGCFKDKREPFTYSTCGKLTYPKRSDNHRDTAFKMSLKYFQRMATRNLAFIGLTEDLHRKYTLWGNSRKLCEYLATNYINEVNEVLITGYFESTLHGSKSASSRFKYPVYRLPPERVGEGKPPTFTRNEIDFGKALSERGLEILYVDDLVDLTFMHIQGSGRVLLEEGGEVRLRYAGKNGHGYRSIGKRVVELNLAPLKELSMERIKDELRKHPHLVEDILSYDPSYVFFREGEGEPIGSLNVPVTPLFSVALDQQNYQRGAPYLLIVNGKEFNVVLNQDSGGAIKGKGRVDRFLGYGKEASALASGMKDKGLLVGLYKRT
jgi:membrane-bound lytic murein transglycosylase A